MDGAWRASCSWCRAVTRDLLSSRLSQLTNCAPDAALDALLRYLRESTSADAALAFRLGSTDDGPRLTSFRIHTPDVDLEERMERALRSDTVWPDYSVPSLRSVEGFVALADGHPADGPDLLASRALDVGARHVLRLLVYRGDEFVGWIGAVRLADVPYSRRVVRHWRTASTVVRRLLAEHIWSAPRHDVEGSAVLLPDGTIRFATLGMEPALPCCVTSVRAVRIEEPFEVRRIHHDDYDIELSLGRLPEGPAVLATVRPMRRIRRAPDSLLTPTQREVASYAIVGATAKEIADTLGTAVDTVKTHLRDIYRRLEVGSRVELAERLRRVPF